ncbi:MAG: c-type cytochrome [Lysobacterales bacterium]
MKSTDSVFLKHFAMVIGFLMAVTGLLMVVAYVIHLGRPVNKSYAAALAVEQRIAPAGAVYAGDTGRAAMLAAEDAAKAAAASQVAYGGTMDGSVIYASLCQACHATGAGGAPKLEKALWSPRMAQGVDMLVQHAIEGYKGEVGIMPAKGGNLALTDEQVAATVQFMVEGM